MPPMKGPPPDLRARGTDRQGPDRRQVLAGFSAGAAALVAGCSSPEEEIVPYIDQPEGLVPGLPMFFATSLPLGGAGRGVIVESHEGRPTKVHGNPAHPASLGATDVFAEAAVLDLFDPARPRVPHLGTTPSTWLAFEAELLAAVPPEGHGARLLTGPVASPTLARQIAALAEARPGLVWHAMRAPPDALDVTLGEAPEARLHAVPDFARAEVIVTLGCDFLGAGPDQIATAKAFSRARAERRGRVRMHAFEPSPTLTGSKADRRTGAARAELAALAAWLADGAAEADALPEHVRTGAQAALAALAAAPGRAMVLAGPDLPPAAALAVARLNERLGGLVAYRARPEGWQGIAPETPEALARAMRSGEVSALVILDANPVHEMAAALGFAEALERVSWTAYAGVTFDETAARCRWKLPLRHPFEDWSDLRGPDGTVGLVQPLIAPLHDSRSRHEVMNRLIGGPASGAREILARTWALWHAARGEPFEGLEPGVSLEPAADPAFEAFWVRALHDGVLEGTAAPLASPDLAEAEALPLRPAVEPADGFELALRTSSTVWTGTHAGNAWLQECPEPFTKQVWGNALWMAPFDALALDLEDGDAVRLATEHGEVQVPVLSVPGQHPGTLSLALGYGRWEAGPIGSGVGVCAAPLMPPDGAAVVAATVTPIGATLPVRRTQTHFEEMGRDIVRTVAAEDPLIPGEPPQPSFYPPYSDEPHAWAMVIDLDLCIGCNACLIACQSENNIPVVGPRRSSGAASCTGCGWTPTGARTGAPPSSPSPACTASRRPASPSARSRPPCTTPRASTCRSTTAASARASARPTAPTRCAASTSSTTQGARPTRTRARICWPRCATPTSRCARAA